jgi:hypothetical protein
MHHDSKEHRKAWREKKTWKFKIIILKKIEKWKTNYTFMLHFSLEKIYI